MSISFGFYDSKNHDRKYNAIQIGSIFDGLVSDGVYQNIGQKFSITEGYDTSVILGTGRGWFNHTWIQNDAPIVIDCGSSDILLDRVDSICIEINAEARTNSVKHIYGVPSSKPVPPELTNTDTVHQYSIADIYRKGGSSTIITKDITIKVGSKACPFVTGVVQSVSVDEIMSKYEAEFNTWFATVQGQLSGDVAANLARRIEEVSREKVSPTELENGVFVDRIDREKKILYLKTGLSRS